MALTEELRYNGLKNPTNEVDISFDGYVSKRSRKFEKHLEGGIPDYAYASDYTLRQKIKSIPGAYRFFKAFNSQVVPLMKQKYNLSAAKVSPSQFPQIYEMVASCANTLGIGIPSVYIEPNLAEMNAFAYATEDAEPMIVLYSSMLERFSLEELKAVIGHECGHIHNLHGVYNTAASVLLTSFQNTLLMSIPGIQQLLGLMSRPLEYALKAWNRAAEVTCDRAGIICAGEVESSLSSQAKLTSGGILNQETLDIDELLKQYDVMRGNPVRFYEWTMDHPLSVRRIMADKEFMNSQVFYDWHPEMKRPDMRLYTKQELDARCDKIISVTKSEKR